MLGLSASLSTFIVIVWEFVEKTGPKLNISLPSSLK